MRETAPSDEGDFSEDDEVELSELRPLSIRQGEGSEEFENELPDEGEETAAHNRRLCLIRAVFCLSAEGVVAAIALLFFLHPTSISHLFSHGGKGVEEHVRSFTHSEAYNELKALSTIENVKHGAVASDHPVCSEIGIMILRDQGGNAVDAAVATALCLGVANPASSGIGGGAFILIHADMTSHQEKVQNEDYVSPSFIDARDPDDTTSDLNTTGKVTEVIDCRETAPAAARTKMFKGKAQDASTWGGLAIAVPGELRGLELAHSRHGVLAWSEVVEPAMKLARDGVRVGPHLAGDIPGYWNQNDGLLSVLTKQNDKITMLEEGDTMTQPTLAATLEAVMTKGADALYNGYRADHLAHDIHQAGGIMTAQDLRNYRPTLRSPLIARDVNGFTLVGAPPPSSGGATIIGAARFLAGYKQSRSQYSSALSKHRMVEAMRHAFSIRMSLSDPSFRMEVTNDAVNDLVCGQYMEKLRRSTLDNTTLPLSQYGGKKWAQLNDNQGGSEADDADEGDRRRAARRFGYLEDHGTTHLSVVDRDGNAVAMTSSVNTLFGSGVVSQSTGIFLNSQMDDFANPGVPNYFGLQPSEANYIKPRKKPLSSMSPTLVFRQRHKKATDLGEFFMALGASGGPKIITAVLQSFLNFANGMSLFDAIIHPRLHDQLLYHESLVTLYEKTQVHEDFKIEVPDAIKQGLEARGHKIHSVGTCFVSLVDLRRHGRLQLLF